MTHVLTRGAYALPGTSLAFKTGDWRSTEKPLHHHRKAPCHDACPAGEDQQAWLARLQEGNLEGAWLELVKANPLPAITGRVCPHPCETACNRKHMDQPIAIHNVERWLGDEAISRGWQYPVTTPSAEAPKVAVVGAGPGGLSAAYHLVRLGYRATVFEALPEIGGLLRAAIPMTRLPRSIIDAEGERLLALPGLELLLRQKLGRDVSLAELRSEFAAVVLAPGCQKSRPWDVAGAVPQHLHEGLHLLKEWIDHGWLPEARRVVVHGGGNTAVDLCRIMKRNGAEEVHLLTASGLPGPDTDPDDVLNVVPRELEEALEEGIQIHPHVTINRLIMKGSVFTGVEMVSLRKLPGQDGRKRRIPFEGTERLLHCDMVVPSIGEIVDPEGIEEILGQHKYLHPKDDTCELGDHPGVYVLGDARGDRGTVAAAIGDGRMAALTIQRRINGAEPLPPDTREVATFDKLNIEYFDRTERAPLRKLPVAERNDESEIELDLTGPEAAAEARRCMSCGNCLACDNCWTLCPDNAVIKTVEMASDGTHYVFDYDFCKGCGLCSAECPCGFIDMVPEDTVLPAATT